MNYLDSKDCDNTQFSIYENKFDTAMFDSRVFNLPESEVCNYFVWRQQDATRNSIETLGREYFTQAELYKVNCNQIQDKLMVEKNVNWNDCPTFYKRGACVEKKENAEKDYSAWSLDMDIPIFTKDRNYIEKHLEVEDK
jgi:tRNA(His) 5'-end guanylyltransferase